MMELRERVDESAGDAAAIAALQVEAEHERSAALGRLAQIFASISTGSVGAEAARAAWTEMNVVRAFDRVLEQLQREAGGV
jgi:hypothetical protein